MWALDATYLFIVKVSSDGCEAGDGGGGAPGTQRSVEFLGLAVIAHTRTLQQSRCIKDGFVDTLPNKTWSRLPWEAAAICKLYHFFFFQLVLLNNLAFIALVFGPLHLMLCRLTRRDPGNDKWWMHIEIPKHFSFLWLVKFKHSGAWGQQPSVSLTRSDLFMKPTKVPLERTRAIWLPGDQYATVHHPAEVSGHVKCQKGAFWRLRRRALSCISP